MEPKKLTKQEFADKYGYDPRTRTSVKAPTMGAIGGSSEPKQTLTPEEVQMAMTSQPKQTLTPDEVAKISGMGANESGYKPGKFIQSMEDIRPDYSGGTLSDIGEGLGDIGVGVAKGITRMPVNIAQALTPDKMWGENSLLNSDSERARAFESATKGKTGLQKLGATGVDVASLFTPVGLEKGGATIAGLAGKGTGSLAKLATGSNTGMLAKGLNYVAPIVGESVAGTAMLGGDAGDIGGDVAISVALPTVLKPAYKYLKNINISPAARASIGDFLGNSKMSEESIQQAAKIVEENGPELAKSNEAGRKIMGEIVTPAQVGSIFGGKTGLVTEEATREFGEVSDVIMNSYLPELGAGQRFDWSKANTQLATDVNDAKKALEIGESKIGKIPVDTTNIIKETKSSMGASFYGKHKPDINDSLQNVQNIFNKFLSTGGLGTKASRSKGILPLTNVDAAKQSISVLARAAKDSGDTVAQKVYVSALDAIDNINAAHTKRAGFTETYADYLAAKSNFSFLKKTEQVMKAMRNAKNPETTKQLTSHIIGLISGSQFGPLAYYPARVLSKILGDSYAAAKINSLHTDPVRQLQALKRRASASDLTSRLTNAKPSNKYSEMVVNQMKRGPKSTKTRSKLAETIAKQKASKAKK